MQEALIGLLGLFSGALLSEYFRAKNRIDIYSQKVFEKRLEIHEGLFDIVLNGYHEVSDVIENKSLTKDERHQRIGNIVHSIAEYTDKYSLYIDEAITVQAVTAFMGAEDIQEIENETERESAISDIAGRYKTTKTIIADESGISAVSKHFRKISKSSPDSDAIRYMNELRKSKIKA